METDLDKLLLLKHSALNIDEIQNLHNAIKEIKTLRKELEETMNFKNLFADVVGEFKKLGDGTNFTTTQLFYFGLVVGKLTGMLSMPWCLVFVLPMATPAHIKSAYGVLSGSFGKVVEAFKK
jgi:hypothetical protein